MIKTIIAAHDPNLVIGKDGELPWHFSEDLKFFKQTTLGHPLLMGRKVFEEIGEKPLPGREAVVLSKSKTYKNVPVFNKLQDAFEYLSDRDRIFIIGGGKIYRQTIDIADELIITEIHKTYDGDTFFPDYRESIGTVWEEVKRDDHEKLSFVKYVRIS
ncbi:MAG: dihydrofolate reductase [Balneolaceae bacterium]